MPLSIFNIHEVSEQRARCLLAARVARHVGENDLVAELVAEARRYHRRLLSDLGAIHYREVSTRYLRHAPNMRAVAMHRGGLSRARSNTALATR